ncbi:AraC family transcriptional regulator [Pendulispora albinea]|uniref:AraC family transcriptional regulator n=1 Tax=Pendulispora albinea TaxID=2741071 RepID=A0ABZ2LVS6_9BACT
MDALSEALRSFRITGAVFFNAELTAPWGFSSKAASDVAHLLAPGTEHLVLFHLVTEGRATASIAGHGNVELEAGDIVVFPHGDAHELRHGHVAVLTDSAELLPKILSGSLEVERGGGGGEPTKFVCGYFGCERYAERLFLAGLPPVFKVDVRGDAAGAWLETSIRHLVSEVESPRAGRRALLSKLSEALFIEVLCRYMDALPPERIGWLAAARDPMVGKALACIHGAPARAWTLASLAREAGTSRTVLVDRFTHLLGQSPLAYLGRWRLQIAARLLETTDRKVLQVALDVGYESEAAFNRAFKRELGAPPARYRRSVRETMTGLVARGH